MLIVSGRFTIGELERLITYTGLGKLSVGFVILAVMTSLPEVSVAIFSILQGNPGLSIGDIFGSNVFNMGLVVGVIAVSGFFKKCCSDLLVELTDLLFLITYSATSVNLRLRSLPDSINNNRRHLVGGVFH
jgi:Ca2+/Na+ antiporter